MRLSWYADSAVAVFSIWQGNRCTGTFRLPFGDLARMVQTLQSGPHGAGAGFGDPGHYQADQYPPGPAADGAEYGYQPDGYEGGDYAAAGDDGAGYDGSGYDGAGYDGAGYAAGYGPAGYDQEGYGQPGGGYPDDGYQEPAANYEGPGYEGTGYAGLVTTGLATTRLGMTVAATTGPATGWRWARRGRAAMKAPVSKRPAVMTAR